jgi:translation initiation factor 2B subunit (eIF-2B alpha/beta/delta family)
MSSDHPAIQTVVDRIRSDAIGGAADIAREVVDALAKMVQDSQAQDATAHRRS